MHKGKKLLLFKIHLDVLNDILGCFKKGASILPEDLELFRINAPEYCVDTYYIMLSSKEFPLVKSGEKVDDGEVEYDKGTLIFKRKALIYGECQHD